jgi:tRNA pseudouridine55 synthase
MFLLINKPKNWTSHDVVGYLRKITKIKKIGHSGTLDPFATGLLIVAIEKKYTKQIDKFHNLDKTYAAELTLGKISDTYDCTGKISDFKKHTKPAKKEIEKTIIKFIGEQKQIPPMFSAKKIKGQKLYDLARKGIEIKRKPNIINIYSIKINKYSYPILSLTIRCSTGTYIRSIANDIGKELKIGAYCSKLKRTKIGDYDLKNAGKIKQISSENLKKYSFE